VNAHHRTADLRASWTATDPIPKRADPGKAGLSTGSSTVRPTTPRGRSLRAAGSAQDDDVEVTIASVAKRKPASTISGKQSDP
jgi:hypothetical protein